MLTRLFQRSSSLNSSLSCVGAHPSQLDSRRTMSASNYYSSPPGYTQQNGNVVNGRARIIPSLPLPQRSKRPEELHLQIPTTPGMPYAAHLSSPMSPLSPMSSDSEHVMDKVNFREEAGSMRRAEREGRPDSLWKRFSVAAKEEPVKEQGWLEQQNKGSYVLSVCCNS